MCVHVVHGTRIYIDSDDMSCLMYMTDTQLTWQKHSALFPHLFCASGKNDTDLILRRIQTWPWVQFQILVSNSFSSEVNLNLICFWGSIESVCKLNLTNNTRILTSSWSYTSIWPWIVYESQDMINQKHLFSPGTWTWTWSCRDPSRMLHLDWHLELERNLKKLYLKCYDWHSDAQSYPYLRSVFEIEIENKIEIRLEFHSELSLCLRGSLSRQPC